MYLRRQVTLIFTALDVKKWSHFMQIRRKRKEPNGGRLSRNSFKEKLVLYSKFCFENQMW